MTRRLTIYYLTQDEFEGPHAVSIGCLHGSVVAGSREARYLAEYPAVPRYWPLDDLPVDPAYGAMASCSGHAWAMRLEDIGCRSRGWVR